MQSTGYASINGELIPSMQASIGISDLALSRGYGVFDFFRTRNKKPLFLLQHLIRFFHSAKAMHLNLPFTEGELEKCIHEVIVANDHLIDSGIKVLATGGYSDSGYQLGESNIIITCHELPPTIPSQYEKGISIITHEYKRDMPHVKSTNYASGIWLLPAIKAAGAEDVLYHSHGLVFETPRSNLFIVNAHGEVITPVTDILFGITRNNLLTIAKNHFTTQERNVSLEELENASEVFITSTTKRILPVTRIDGYTVGSGKPGPVTLQLSTALLEFEEEYLRSIS